MKVAIVIPSHDTVSTDFALCLVNLVSGRAGKPIAIINSRSSLIQKGRWQGVKDALSINPDKILFIDSDQTFPADALDRLLAHKKKIVCATSKLRDGSGRYAARDSKSKRLDFSQKKGLHKVGSTGFSFALIDASIFRELPEPWFNVSYKEGTWTSEDESFYQQAGKKGYNVWIDADLTKEIGHVGTKIY